MPKYIYKCTQCNDLEEQTHGFHDQGKPSSCHEAPVQKVYPSVGVSFKGPGFYSTDNRK